LKELPWIEEWCRANAGYTLYGEAVPTQKGYTYGTGETEPVRFFVFDILCSDGKWMDKQLFLPDITTHLKVVPVLYAGSYDEAKIKALVEGKSAIDGKTLREGIVISSATEHTVRGLGRAQLKLKSNAFLEKEGKQ
jgi:ATP-dependent RNA circularization protein (DNA/RNA ligase family)